MAQGGAPDVLADTWSPGCAAAIWQRRPQAGLLEWLEALPPESLPETRLVLRPDQVESRLEALCAPRGTTDASYGSLLAGDIGILARLFARIMKTDKVTLRLDVLHDNACRKFHLDHVPARLLCTYRGRGTEYGRSHAGEDPREIRRLPTGAVGLFRGRLWPGPEHSGIVHRSPQIAGLGETRLLLVIDPAKEDDERPS
ncbi:hypothetical protein AUC68_07355 [Methyloceanibacter methanicus]|uniref:DUF1826 domain-containing protein n=1 Tax=Methyloceanibacter methanicus TaxID=1774968 RepID=A0A1E3W0Q5_9HYPH|nr:hypothetical protein AUC68_07355 [Methyloceanibacter methanicus]